MDSILELRNIQKAFGGNQVLKGVSLSLKNGEFLSLIGPNGAGKTSLFQIIGGQYQADFGSILLQGKDISKTGVSERSKMGIGRSFQKSSLYEGMNVLDNIAFSIRLQKGFENRMFPSKQQGQVVSEAVENIIEEMEMQAVAYKKAGELGHADQRKLELALLLGMKPKVMLLDEPAAGMSVEDIPLLLKVLEGFKSNKNFSIILVEHKMDLVMSLSDQIAVLHQGKIIAEGNPSEIAENQDVQNAYIGKN